MVRKSSDGATAGWPVSNNPVKESLSMDPFPKPRRQPSVSTLHGDEQDEQNLFCRDDKPSNGPINHTEIQVPPVTQQHQLPFLEEAPQAQSSPAFSHPTVDKSRHEDASSQVQRDMHEHDLLAHEKNLRGLHAPLLDNLKEEAGYSRTRSNAYSAWFRDWWLWELMGSILSIFCIVAIVAILAAYDRKPLPEWPYSITLNSLLSILSTIAKVSFSNQHLRITLH